MCLGDDPVANPPVQRPRDRRLEHRPCVAVGQAGDNQLRKSRQLLARLTLREDECYSFRAQPPRYESECLRRRSVEPLRVVNDAEDRMLVGNVG